MKFNNIQTLQSRRDSINILCAFKILNNIIDCPEMMEKMNFRVNNIRLRVRNHDMFTSNIHLTNISNNSPINRLMNAGNMASNLNLDFFHHNFERFKKVLFALESEE
uniref:Uncharacterized protein n=1 Tax=Cacopsylla melanoneura TaxID=428564 RepID=A0A8D8QMP8_9HEMI